MTSGQYVKAAMDTVQDLLTKDDRELKQGKYLGARVKKFALNDETQCWSTTSDQYVKAAMDMVQDLLAEDGRELQQGKSKKHKGLLPPGYKPELDTTDPQKKPHGFEQIIGILCCTIELGRIDILTEVLVLSQ